MAASTQAIASQSSNTTYTLYPIPNSELIKHLKLMVHSEGGQLTIPSEFFGATILDPRSSISF